MKRIGDARTLNDYVMLPVEKTWNDTRVHDRNGKLIAVIGFHNLEALEIDKWSLQNFMAHRSDTINWRKSRLDKSGLRYTLELYLNSTKTENDYPLFAHYCAGRYVGRLDT